MSACSEKRSSGTLGNFFFFLRGRWFRRRAQRSLWLKNPRARQKMIRRIHGGEQLNEFRPLGHRCTFGERRGIRLDSRDAIKHSDFRQTFRPAEVADPLCKHAQGGHLFLGQIEIPRDSTASRCATWNECRKPSSSSHFALVVGHVMPRMRGGGAGRRKTGGAHRASASARMAASGISARFQMPRRDRRAKGCATAKVAIRPRLRSHGDPTASA